MKKALFIVSIILVLLVSCSSFTWTFLPSESNEVAKTLSSGADSEQEKTQGISAVNSESKQVVPENNAKPKNKYKKFDSYSYDVEGDDLYALAEVLYSSGEFYGAYRLFDSIGVDTKTLTNEYHFNEYRKQWTKIKSGVDVFFDYSQDPVMYYYFLENNMPGIYSTIPLGSRGPSGGYVFYDKGYYSDGWRFLEASPSNLREKYAAGRYTINGNDVYVNGTKTYNSDCTGTGIGTGRKNTELLVNAISSIWEGPYAAKMCDSYTYTNPINDKVYDDWFLPSLDELSELISVSKKVDCNMVADIQGGWDYWWSSSEEYRFPSRVWGESLSGSIDYTWNGNGRWQKLYVRPVRTF